MNLEEARKYRDELLEPPQKFWRGDIVKIADDLGPSMRHFPAGQIAVVKHTYAELYDERVPRAHKQYSLSVGAWYDEEQLTLIERSESHHPQAGTTNE